MSTKVGRVFAAAFLLTSVAWLPAAAQQGQGAPEVRTLIHHGVSRPLREIPPVLTRDEQRVIPLRPIPRRLTQGQIDTVVQSSAGPLVSTSSGLNFDGVGQGAYGYTVRVAPPDTNGAAGTTQYVQWVNLSFAVFDKATGNLLYGPAAGNTLWQGSSLTACANNNDGDVIAQYDKAANRWVMAQLSYTGGPPYYECIAISATSDALGPYYLYALQWTNDTFPDYPKVGVSPDGYYFTFNMFLSGLFFMGPQVCTLDRSKMLLNLDATVQCIQLSASYDSLLPSDLDGSRLPPTGSPNYFLNLGSSSLNLWKFHVDWTNSNNTTFTGPTGVPIASFNEACSCIPQAGTTQQLDSLGDRLMYRLAYRHFSDGHEALVVNHSVTTGSSVGVRWYEIRSPNTGPFVYQQSTFAPDSNFRWMGSIGMDSAGNIALGYSVSSGSMHPAIRYTGRVPTDPLGTLEAETSIIEGTGSQTKNLGRWGDYSGMSIDPVDDCTFWYTTEYLKTDGTFNWNTRIASFKFSSCSSTPDFSLSASPGSQTVTAGTSAIYTVTVSPTNGFNGTVDFSVAGLPAGASASFSPPSVTGSGSSTLTVTTSGVTPGTYTLTITGTSGTLIHSTTVTLVVRSLTPPDFSIAATPSSQTVTRRNSASYTVTVTALNGFNGIVSFSVSGLPARSTASFNPTSVTGSGSSTLMVSANKNTATGTVRLTITGTSGSLVHSTSVSLTVNK